MDAGAEVLEVLEAAAGASQVDAGAEVLEAAAGASHVVALASMACCEAA